MDATVSSFGRGLLTWTALADALDAAPPADVAHATFDLVAAVLDRAPSGAADAFSPHVVPDDGNSDAEVTAARRAIGAAAAACPAREVVVALHGLAATAWLGSSPQLCVALELAGGALQHAVFRGSRAGTSGAVGAREARAGVGAAARLAENSLLDVCVQLAHRWRGAPARACDAAMAAAFARAATHTFRLVRSSPRERVPGAAARVAVLLAAARGALLAAITQPSGDAPGATDADATLAVCCAAIDALVPGRVVLRLWAAADGAPRGAAADGGALLASVGADGGGDDDEDDGGAAAVAARVVAYAFATPGQRPRGAGDDDGPAAASDTAGKAGGAPSAPPAFPAALAEGAAAWALRDVLLGRPLPAAAAVVANGPEGDEGGDGGADDEGAPLRRRPADMVDPNSALVSAWAELRRGATAVARRVPAPPRVDGTHCSGAYCAPAVPLVASPAARLALQLPHFATVVAVGAHAARAAAVSAAGVVNGGGAADAASAMDVDADSGADADGAVPSAATLRCRGEQLECSRRAVAALRAAADGVCDAAAAIARDGAAFASGSRGCSPQHLLTFVSRADGASAPPAPHAAAPPPPAHRLCAALTSIMSYADARGDRAGAHGALAALIAAHAPAGGRYDLLAGLCSDAEEPPVAALLLDMARAQVAVALRAGAAPSHFAEAERAYALVAAAVGRRLSAGLARPAAPAGAPPAAAALPEPLTSDAARAVARYLDGVCDVDLSLLSTARLLLGTQRQRGATVAAPWAPFSRERLRYFRDGYVRPLAEAVSRVQREMREVTGVGSLLPHARPFEVAAPPPTSSASGAGSASPAPPTPLAPGSDGALLSRLFLLDAALVPVSELIDALLLVA